MSKKLLFFWISTVVSLAAIAQSSDASRERPNSSIVNAIYSNLKIEGYSFTSAIRVIENIYKIHVEYASGILDPTVKISFELDNADLSTAISKFLSNYKSQYYTFNIIYTQNKVLIQKAFIEDQVSNYAILKGRVSVINSNEVLAGATVQILKPDGSAIAGIITDERGMFRIPNIPVGTYAIKVGYIGYKTQYLKNIVLEPGKETVVNVSLASENVTTEEVVVEARRNVNTEIGVLNERKKASIVSDGISARQIEKTASITTAQALQRVTGVTITDDKYVAIRGLGDRAVIAELNGIRLSSSNPDRSAAPIDIVPAALLDNVTVYKTLTPDRPADASAGIIELKTKSVPDSFSVYFTSQVGTNSSIGFNGSYNSFLGANLGFWGENVTRSDLSKDFLNLANQYPGGRVQLQNLFIESRHDPNLAIEANRVNRIMQLFSPVLSTTYQSATPNQLYTVSIGNTFRIFNGHALGVIVSGNYYHRTEDRYNGELNQYSLYQGLVTGPTVGFTGGVSYTPIYVPLHIPNFITPDNVQLGKYLSYRQNTGIETLSYGYLLGVTYQINSRNELSAQYLSSTGAEQSGSNLTGSFANTGLDYPVYNVINSIKLQHRIFNTLNFQGEHKINLGKWTPKFSWNGSFSHSTEDDPDNRTTNYVDASQIKFLDANGVGLGTNQYQFVTGAARDITPQSGDFYVNPNGRFYRKLDEKNYNLKGDLMLPFSLLGQNQLFKIGFNYLHRDRSYDENVLDIPGTYTNAGTGVIYDNGLLNQLNGNLNSVVSYNQIGLQNPTSYDQYGQPRVGGFLYQTLKTPNNYGGVYETNAAYAMLDGKIFTNLRIAGGVRFESTYINSVVDTNHVNNVVFTSGPLSVNSVSVSPITNLSVSYKPYYSVNLIYSLLTNMNLRFSFNTALARPELRELTNIYEYDPFQFGIIVGNPNLINQSNKNYDFRWELITGSGEVISASAFYKEINSQLTKTFSQNSHGNLSTSPEYPIIKFVNDPNRGKVYGLEFEIRKDIGKLISPLRNFFIGSNLLIASSEITKNADRLKSDRTIDRLTSLTSPVFEQAPYSINAYIDYDNRATGSSFTVSFNEVGERLVQVNLDGTPDLYDRPVPLLDFVFSQKFLNRFVVKGFIKNILNSDYKTVYAIPGEGGLYRNREYVYSRYKRGTEFSLGVTYRLF